MIVGEKTEGRETAMGSVDKSGSWERRMHSAVEGRREKGETEERQRRQKRRRAGAEGDG